MKGGAWRLVIYVVCLVKLKIRQLRCLEINLIANYKCLSKVQYCTYFSLIAISELIVPLNFTVVG